MSQNEQINHLEDLINELRYENKLLNEKIKKLEAGMAYAEKDLRTYSIINEDD